MTSSIQSNWPNSDRSTRRSAAGIDWHVQIAAPEHAIRDHDSANRRGEGKADVRQPGPAPAESDPHALPVVLLLHGTGGSTHEWADVLPPLARDAIVVAPDLPGHGFSRSIERSAWAGDPMSLPGMAAAVAELLRTLALRPTVIAGHSAGAAVALRLVLDGHVAPRAVIGFNPALIPPPDIWVQLLAPIAGVVAESSWIANAASWAARRAGVTRTLLTSSGATLSAEQVARYETLFASPAHCAGALAMMSRWDLPALARDAAGLTVPFAAYAGARDQWVPYGALAEQVARIPGATLVEVPGVGHLLPEEAPQVAVAAIRRAIAP